MTSRILRQAEISNDRHGQSQEKVSGHMAAGLTCKIKPPRRPSNAKCRAWFGRLQRAPQLFRQLKEAKAWAHTGH